MGSEIKRNIDEIENRILKACERSGRKREDILLIAVSKTVSVPHIKEAVKCGLYELGENRVQEIIDKYEPMGDEVKWHLIGHLQTNKVKYIIDKVELIHSVDSIKLAEEINKRAQQKGIVCNILIEVNVANEQSKFGIKYEEVESFIKQINNFKNIKVCGLMTVAPLVENSERNRQYFKQLKQLLIDINGKNIDNINMNILSMGMTGDFEVAIEEGATIIRVGTGIFGNRVYSN